MSGLGLRDVLTLLQIGPKSHLAGEPVVQHEAVEVVQHLVEMSLLRIRVGRNVAEGRKDCSPQQRANHDQRADDGSLRVGTRRRVGVCPSCARNDQHRPRKGCEIPRRHTRANPRKRVARFG
eukprot:7377384-Prymnesium_polylepis.1